MVARTACGFLRANASASAASISSASHLAEGKRAMARKDFQKVLAENANYPGLADHLAAVGE